ncbi:stress response protein nst1 [Anaeramoeba flamelloides]|uniref:Stress response protein nst1 n=1 Tax=Anaeramoeba flamelloides TaxID=1746091 RepID=A0AAV7YX03_9EUKA|nr:stress response protein nst1 [Anaeramoeba flamelloides]
MYNNFKLNKTIKVVEFIEFLSFLDFFNEQHEKETEKEKEKDVENDFDHTQASIEFTNKLLDLGFQLELIDRAIKNLTNEELGYKQGKILNLLASRLIGMNQKKEKVKKVEKEEREKKKKETNETNHKESEELGRDCELDLSKLSILAITFLKKAKRSLTKTAMLMGFEIKCKKPSSLHLTKDNIILKTGQIKQLIRLVEKRLYKPEIYDYKSISENVLLSVKNWFITNFDYLQSVGLEKVYITQNEPIGEKWSTSFDISYCGGSDFGNEIGCPNPLKFSQVQTSKTIIYNWENYYSIRPNRIFLDFWYLSYLAIPHEFVHCIQSKLGQLDKTILNWSAEHDASFLSYSVLHSIYQQDKKQQEEKEKEQEQEKEKELEKEQEKENNKTEENNDQMEKKEIPKLFQREGLIELLLYCGAEMTYKHYNRWAKEKSQEVEQLYLKWVQSFGLNGPKEGMKLKKGVILYFKDRVAMEGLRFDFRLVKKSVDTCLKNRTGEVHEVDLKIPKGVQIENNVNGINKLMSPVDEKVWKRVFLEYLT